MKIHLLSQTCMNVFVLNANKRYSEECGSIFFLNGIVFLTIFWFSKNENILEVYATFRKIPVINKYYPAYTSDHFC